MSDRPIVYLGPSLGLGEAEQMLDADYRPPVRRGDLPTHYAGAILIVDGEFGQSLSVSPREIVCLLNQGTRVIGAGSMGALRAAELASLGMEGCGWIYEAYRTGRITGDDEVAVMYSPFDGRSLTIPLVNVRYWLGCLEEAGMISHACARRLLVEARRVFFADRTLDRLYDHWEHAIGSETLQALLSLGGEIPDVKAADARLGLEWVACEVGTQLV